MAYIEIPEVIFERAKELNKLCSDYPRTIPSDAYAEFCGIDKETFRTLVQRGECPFGFGKNKSEFGRGFAKLPTLATYNWHTCGILYVPNVSTSGWRER